LLIHGARAVLGRAATKQDPRSQWLNKLRERRHPNIVAVALANKGLGAIEVEAGEKRGGIRKTAAPGPGCVVPSLIRSRLKYRSGNGISDASAFNRLLQQHLP